jgi:molybdopterin synthase catalytic subunit/molybdopterin converting factor small subunit
MRVVVRCFASLRELVGERTELDLPGDPSLADAWLALVEHAPALGAHRPYVRAARNGAYAEWDEQLADGDEIAFLPPVAGGSATVGLTDRPIDIGVLATIAVPAHGAMVTFVGRARNRADDGREVLELEYEAYPEMAESVLAEIVGEVEQRWGAAASVVHRVGVVPIGEAAVAIVTAAPHRGVAYEANRYVIEAIKERLPIWKRERFADGSEWKRPGA